MDRIGRYKIVRELGRGAMGVVYHAIDPNIGRPVAIKTIYFGGNRKPEDQNRMRERLFREARSAGMLSHPGIVTIYDVEQQGELAYIAMEFVDGPTLDQVLGEPDPPPQEQLFSILGQTAVALDYAHSKGIVHRDIKPANIMLAADGTSKIADFGIAKIAEAENLTVTGSIVGTPHYMSPEQVQGLQVDGRSDQFSLAVIAFEMLTGEKPFTGEHLTTVVYKIVAEEPIAAHRLNATLSAAIENVLRKALAKKPDARYRTCQEFIEALEKACSISKGWRLMPRGSMLNEPTLAAASPLAPAPSSAAASSALPPPRRPARRTEATATATAGSGKKSHFLSFLLAILVAAGLLALIGWQAAPWIMQELKVGAPNPTPAPVATAKAEPPAAPPAPSANPTPVQPPATTPATAPVPADAKPSPIGPAETPVETKPAPVTPEVKPEAKPEVKPDAKPSAKADGKPPAKRPAAPERMPAQQEVSILSSPGGATATLDGNPSASCATPCTLRATAGKHTVAFALSGYQLERHEFNVGTSSLELAPVVLKAVRGTLMLTSVPTGAAVSVNGKSSGLVTPASLTLAPGTYNITVSKDGHETTQKIEIRNDLISRRIVIE